MYYLYILKCTDDSLYTGITTDIQKRFQKHLSGKGAKYTRSHRPRKVVYAETFRTKSRAAKREYEIKSWPRDKKLALIKNMRL